MAATPPLDPTLDAARQLRVQVFQPIDGDLPPGWYHHPLYQSLYVKRERVKLSGVSVYVSVEPSGALGLTCYWLDEKLMVHARGPAPSPTEPTLLQLMLTLDKRLVTARNPIFDHEPVKEGA